MDRVTLGRDGPEVSAVCLGTITFGTRTGAAEAGAQMDRALARGIDFFDCAEMYPVTPVRAETTGDSERIIGAWLAARGLRDRVQIATKVTGPGSVVRGGEGFDGAILRRCVDQSLARLGVERIALYQLHWPMRGSYHFRQLWGYDPSGQSPEATRAHMDEVLGVLAELVAAGKIAAFGLSNETCWGTTRWIDRAAARGGPRVVAVQNEYSLLCRSYDGDMAEMAVNEAVTLLAYSPLAAGLLSGKYAQAALPADSRAAADRASGGKGDLGGRLTVRAGTAVAAYRRLAEESGWDPIHLALAFTRARPFAVVPILGATTEAQLAHQLAGLDRRLTPDLAAAIDAIQRDHPMVF